MQIQELINGFESRLLDIFQNKANEFTKYAEEAPTNTAMVASQLAGLYRDLAEAMSH
jgi:hypothetical protein